MTLAEVMRRNAIVRPDEVAELAQTAGLDLTCACVLLIKESGGGRNVWGHDAVPTAGTYDKGSVVDRGHYLAYLAAVKAGRAGRQGVGPTQLTAADYQDAADQAGGCWDWRVNCLTGFRILAGHITRYGERGGFVAYNGGPGALAKPGTHPAQLYGDDAVRKLAVWRPLLADSPAAPPAPPEDDMPLTANEIAAIADAVWLRGRPNYWGDVVAPLQVLNGSEARVSDVQNKIAAPGGVDLDALAGKVVDLLAARLGR